MSNHTPEPWFTDETFIGSSASDQLNSGYFTAHCLGPDAAANARRIVACVNALAGVPTEWLEKFSVDGSDNVAQENARLTKQRDELLAALQGMIDIASDSQGIAGYHLNGAVAYWDEFEEWQAACDAIAKSKGGAA